MIGYENDTIAAIATKLGVGAISIIRISGKDAISLVNKIFEGKDLEAVKSHTIHYGYIVRDKEKIDEVLVTVMKAPKTFTREDVVEINCHGGINTTLTVFSLLQELGIKAADRGDFQSPFKGPLPSLRKTVREQHRIAATAARTTALRK